MPANSSARKSKEPKRGRQSGSVTRFPGSTLFAKAHDLCPTHVWRVLSGQRQSAKVINGYAAWAKKNGLMNHTHGRAA